MNPNDVAAPAQRVARASMLIDLAVISLLVDKGVLAPDELIERIEALYNRMTNFQQPGVMEIAEGILSELRARPGARA